MVAIGVAQWVLEGHGPSTVARAAQLGFCAIQIDAGAPDETHYVGEPAACREYCAASARSGVTIAALAARRVETLGVLGPNDCDATHRCRDLVRAAIDAAAQLGAPLVYVPSFQHSEICSDEDLSRTADFLRDACEYAGTGPVAVGTENTLGSVGNLELLARVSHPRLRVLVDHYNAVLWGHDPLEMIAARWPHACGQIHCKDGRHGAMGNAPLGDGDSRFHAACEQLVITGFDGLVVSENDYRSEGERRAAQDLFALRRYFAAASTHVLIPV